MKDRSFAQSRRRWSSGLFTDLTAIAAGFDAFAAVMEHGLASVLRALKLRCGAICQRTLAGEFELEVGTAAGNADSVRQPLARCAPLLERVLRAGEPCIVAESDAAPLLEHFACAALLFVPLDARGEPRERVIVLALDGDARSTDLLTDAAEQTQMLEEAIELAGLISRIAASERRFRALAEKAMDGIIVADDAGIITFANASASHAFGGAHEGLLGRRIEDVNPCFAEPPRAHVLRAGGSHESPYEITHQSFEDPPGVTNTVYVMRDLSIRQRLDELAWLAHHDPLTGLVNRRRFEEELGSRLTEASRYDLSGALLAIDLDEFKPINDRHGHAAGDRVLCSVANVLASVTRASDITARIGGDEFMVLLSHTGAQGALACARKIVEHLSDSVIDFEGHALRVAASVGIALFPRDGSSPETLLREADAALYVAKEAGRRRVSFSPRAEADTIPPAHLERAEPRVSELVRSDGEPLGRRRAR